MAVETMRGCGYRKVGGLYLVGGELEAGCDRLPVELTVCPCCNQGIKPARGWSWINPEAFLTDDHANLDDGKCSCPPACPVCNPSMHFRPDERAGLLWIGEAFYKTPADFTAEAARQGVSRRISSLPKGFEVGKTWVFFAHRKCSHGTQECAACGGDGLPPVEARTSGDLYCAVCGGTGKVKPTFPGIFIVFRPRALERIVKQSEFDHYKAVTKENVLKVLDGGKWYDLVPKEDEVFWRLKRDTDRGITLVPVPDDDPDHQSRNGKDDD
jgi:hypothetical protein